MYTFLSLIVIIVSLYYIGDITTNYNSDTSYLTPLIIMLIYSIISAIRNGSKGFWSWLVAEDIVFDSYYGAYNKNSYNNNYRNNSNETVEYYDPDPDELYYPTRSEVRDKIKKLEESSWFRFKRDVASIFAIDITEKYRKKFSEPIKVKRKKEDNRRYMPGLSWLEKREIEEYNGVAKRVKKRSCEISLKENINDEKIPTATDGKYVMAVVKN